MFGDSEDESDASEAEAAPAPAPPAAKKPKPSPPTSGLPSAAALLADSSRPAYVEVAAPPEDVTVAAPIAKPNSQSSNTAGLEQAAEERRFRDTHEALKKEGKARQAKRRRELGEEKTETPAYQRESMHGQKMVISVGPSSLPDTCRTTYSEIPSKNSRWH
mmetsp:Transcript_3620/g.10942  ORF Transcript_3620/g.10942 Transcript_3620/m.10942 type:complete len:161 (-) Transcript_3620:35-517(-)